MQAIAPVNRTTLISCLYDATGLVWVRMFDNTVLSWLIDETGVLPPSPVIVGSLAPVPPVTHPVHTPRWASRDTWEFIIPDVARGSPGELFTFIATNGGIHRPIYANFSDTGLINDFATWARAHPTLFLKEMPL